MCNQANLKALTRHLVARVGGPKCAAQICGVSETEISYWGADHHNRFIPVDHLVDLDAAAGDLFLKDMARLRGFELVALESKQDAAANVFKAIGEFSKHGGELGFATLEAASDHKITPNEKRAIRDRMRPVKDALDKLENIIAQ